MSLLHNVQLERNSDAQRGIVLLCNALDSVLFSTCWDEEVWNAARRTLERALFRCRMDAVLRQPGMLYHELEEE